MKYTAADQFESKGEITVKANCQSLKPTNQEKSDDKRAYP